MPPGHHLAKVCQRQLPLAMYHIIKPGKGCQQRAAHFRHTRRAAKDQGQLRVQGLNLPGRQKRGQQLVKADGKSHQIKLPPLLPGKPVLEMGSHLLPEAVNILPTRRFALPESFRQKGAQHPTLFRKQHPGVQPFTEPDILGDFLIELKAQGLGQPQIGMQADNLQIRLDFGQIALEYPQLDGRPVEKRPRHGD